MPIVGRKEEQNLLRLLLDSKQAEFLALYGRRRIGKTFLIREFFKEKAAVFFNAVGLKGGSLSDQLHHFNQEISRVFYQGVDLKRLQSWDATFERLTKAFLTLPKNQKIVLFFDEIPWMATRRSKLLENLDYYWNRHWSEDKRIKLIICGSSASWIINKIINNKGGLHNRITRQLSLEPFNLKETKTFLLEQKITLNHQQILQIYMLTGGVPYYLKQLKRGLSATQLIEELAFKKNGVLLNEFDNLFSSLFTEYELCEEIVRLIANQRYGISQTELFKIKKNIKGKTGLTKLKELEQAGFIISFKPQFHERRGIFYKVIDEYILFYLQWIEPIKTTLLKKSLPIGYWEKQQKSAAWFAWSGLAFEAICYKHLSQISDALKLSPTALPNAWRYAPIKGGSNVVNEGAQIDLLFDRDDGAITICEIKYTQDPFLLDKQYAKILQKKLDVFKKITHTKKQLFLTMITANGLKDTMYAEEMIDGIVTLEDLFK